ncbi:uncharacterized protein LOC107681197 [Sinocyclocheilus anshuiensis]|uniref:uncharacterized protein LOC107681197 n=1 Tax=Sinocyclocheilus anshuiensis TaxID=1608454 RepID=UPI0007B94E2F|nr:PREDICTED: uncharacterized protein LOC107681197 [Sinocyclocheilus anshuiensis]
MDPETLTSKDLMAVIAQHESSFQRHEAVLSHQEELITKHSQLLADVMGSIHQLFERLPGASPPTASPPSGNRPTLVAEPRLPPPKPFAGVMIPHPNHPVSGREASKHLLALNQGSRSTADFAIEFRTIAAGTFKEEFKRVFDHPVSGREASKRLLALNQGSRSTADFAIEFRTIAAGSRWNDEALMVCFQGGLSEPLQDDLATREPAADLETLFAMAIRLDNRLRERRVARHKASQFQVPVNRSVSPVRIPASRASSAPEQPHESPEDMQLGRSRLSHRSAGTIMSWGSTCHLTCLSPSVPSSEFQDSVDLSRVPSSYHQFKAVFCKSRATSLPPHRPYDCAIELLPGSCPPRGRIFSLSSPERTAMDTYIKESLAAGIIRASTSPAGAGFFFVGKKDGVLRPCIDYRGLNKIMVRNQYPLPLMATAFELLQGASIFTKLDLRNAYHLVRIQQGDEWKTAFNTPTGHYEYLVMPFGLTNAPAVFQALINDVLRDMLNQFVFVYLDDILIFSGSLEEHEGHVSRVLQRLLDNHLYVKPEKCEFHVTQAQFLGFIITPGHVEMDPKKVEAVLNWPIPATVKEVQRFIGFANFYRRFITNFSSVVAPLTTLTKGGGIKIHWGSEAAGAFEELKHPFT